MLTQLGDTFRLLSRVALFVGLLAAFYTEAFADIPTRRDGRPKPPMSQQRLVYLLIRGSGVLGVAWGFYRAVKNKQRTPWE